MDLPFANAFVCVQACTQEECRPPSDCGPLIHDFEHRLEVAPAAPKRRCTLSNPPARHLFGRAGRGRSETVLQGGRAPFFGSVLKVRAEEQTCHSSR